MAAAANLVSLAAIHRRWAAGSIEAWGVLRCAVADRGTISSVVPCLVANAASCEGIDPALILGAAGLSMQGPQRPEDHVDVDVYLDVWRRTVALIPDAAFALRAASAVKLEDHGVFGFLAISCETLGEALERTTTYRALTCIGARWEVHVDPVAMRVIWHPWPGAIGHAGYRAAMDYAVATMVNAIRRLGRSGPRPATVRLAHRAPNDTSAFIDHYGVEPTFGCSGYELVYPADTYAVPVSTFNSQLRDYFDEECRRLLSKLGPGSSMVEQVRQKLTSVMDGGDTSMETIAKQFAMSRRSLQRRLTSEGTRYYDLLDDIRSEFAKRYLSRGTVSASEVAHLIGFTDPSAFFKAFKRWTGMTPQEFRDGAGAR